MATVDLPLCNPYGAYQANHTNYATLHALDTVTWASSAGGGSALAQNDYSTTTSWYYISRALVFVDLTGLSAPCYISSATLVCPYTTLWATHTDFYATLVDGTDIYGESGAFGLFRLRTTSLGELLIPIQTYSNGNACEIPLNSTGILQLEAAIGSTTTLGIRIDEEINATAPGLVNERQNFSPWVSGAAHPVAYVRIVYNTGRCFTIPDLFDDHGRVAKGARVRAYRADTLAFIKEETIDKYGNATLCGLPQDVDVVFHVTWGGGG